MMVKSGLEKIFFLPQIGEFFIRKLNIKSKKSFLNQIIYVLKFWLLGQSFLNTDSFLNYSFLNQDFTVTKMCYCLRLYGSLFII